MNAHGLALVNNDLLTRAVRHGVPSQAVRRHALDRETARGAVAAIVATPAVGGRAYLVADAGGELATVELAAEAGPRVTWHRDHAAHTNHALDGAVAAGEDRTLLASTYPSSRSRLRRAAALLAGGGPVGGDSLRREILADHSGFPLSICRHPSAREPTVTAASVVFDCARLRASIALGNPCTAAPVEISLAAG
jgi:isopenicillin-N N-acyltransferase-like protein